MGLHRLEPEVDQPDRMGMDARTVRRVPCARARMECESRGRQQGGDAAAGRQPTKDGRTHGYWKGVAAPCWDMSMASAWTSATSSPSHGPTPEKRIWTAVGRPGT